MLAQVCLKWLSPIYITDIHFYLICLKCLSFSSSLSKNLITQHATELFTYFEKGNKVKAEYGMFKLFACCEKITTDDICGIFFFFSQFFLKTGRHFFQVVLSGGNLKYQTMFSGKTRKINTFKKLSVC